MVKVVIEKEVNRCTECPYYREAQEMGSHIPYCEAIFEQKNDFGKSILRPRLYRIEPKCPFKKKENKTSYEAPVEIDTFTTTHEMNIDDEIVLAIETEIGVKVNKERLLDILKNDKASWEAGHTAGFKEGYDKGLKKGYNQGWSDGFR